MPLPDKFEGKKFENIRQKAVKLIGSSVFETVRPVTLARLAEQLNVNTCFH